MLMCFIIPVIVIISSSPARHILPPNFSLTMRPMAALRHVPLTRAVQFRALTISCASSSSVDTAASVAVPPVDKNKQGPRVLLGMSESDLQQLALEFGQVCLEWEVNNYQPLELILLEELLFFVILWQDKYRGKQLHHLLYKRKVNDIQDFSQGE